MNETSQILVNAARDALLALPNDRTSVAQDAAVATAAVLRQIAVLMNTAELDELADPVADEDWPDAGDLVLLADDIEASQDQRSLETRIVDAVLKNLTDRSGFDGWWGTFDADVRLDVVTELETTVCALLEEAGL